MNNLAIIDRAGQEPAESKHEVVRFLQSRLETERLYLATQHRHLAEATGCLRDLTLVNIALLENDIIGTERLLKSVH